MTVPLELERRKQIQHVVIRSGSFSLSNIPTNLVKCPNNVFYRILFSSSVGYSPGSCIKLGCYVSLLSFNLEQFISFSLSFMTLTFLKGTGQFFYRLFLNFWFV